MSRYSKKSLEQLETCCKELQEIFAEVIKIYDCTITEGHRNEKQQNELYKANLSKVQFPNGNHNKIPSDAVDAYPCLKGLGVSYDANDCSFMAGVVFVTAERLGYKIRWGGIWDNNSIKTNRFKDMGHYEIIR